MDLYDKLFEAFGVVEQYLEYQHCFMSFGFWFFFFFQNSLDSRDFHDISLCGT